MPATIAQDHPRAGVAFVTGAGGFLGGAVAASLEAAGWRVARIARRPEGGDLDEGLLAQAARAAGPPDLFFHAAGGSSVGASFADPGEDRRRTVGSLQQALAHLEKTAPRARLVYPSSGAVYGAGHAGPIPETAAPDPISPYGAHKLEAERLIGEAAAGFGLDAVILRFFSIYGPGLRKQLLWELAGRLAAAPARIELAGSGEETRDFLYVDDAVALVRLAAGLEPQASPRVLNGGAGEAVSVRRIAEGLARAMHAVTAVAFDGSVRAGDPQSMVADMAKARALGFAPSVPLDAGLARLAAWRLGLEAPGAY
jgi:UDP-glucose 4-epimerase